MQIAFRGFSLPPIISKQTNNIIHCFSQQCYLLMWTLSPEMETIHHRGVQCGEEQPRFSPVLYPFCCAGLAICHCVYTHQPGNCNLRNISYRRRQLWAVTLWIRLTWILSFRRDRSSICYLEHWDAQSTKTFVPNIQSCLWKYFGKQI